MTSMKSIEQIVSEVSQSHRYRYDTVKEFSANLKSLSERYREKIKKYRRNVTIIDITVYSVSGVRCDGQRRGYFVDGDHDGSNCSSNCYLRGNNNRGSRHRDN